MQLRKERTGSYQGPDYFTIDYGMSARPRCGACGELARAFTWLGLTAFGGPGRAPRDHAARVRGAAGAGSRRARFVDLLGLSSLLPGPVLDRGRARYRLRAGSLGGSLVAGLGFILPAACWCLRSAIVYERRAD